MTWSAKFLARSFADNRAFSFDSDGIERAQRLSAVKAKPSSVSGGAAIVGWASKQYRRSVEPDLAGQSIKIGGEWAELAPDVNDLWDSICTS
jgi:hypothetical protein